LLNNPRAAGVSLAVDLLSCAVCITSEHYDVATVTLRDVAPLLRGEVTAEDVLAVPWGAEAFH